MARPRCDVCGGDADYPMLISHAPRTLCAATIHQKSLSMMLQLKWRLFLSCWLERRRKG